MNPRTGRDLSAIAVCRSAKSHCTSHESSPVIGIAHNRALHAHSLASRFIALAICASLVLSFNPASALANTDMENESANTSTSQTAGENGPKSDNTGKPDNSNGGDSNEDKETPETGDPSEADDIEIPAADAPESTDGQINATVLLDDETVIDKKGSRAANAASATVSYTTQMYNMFGPLAPQFGVTVQGDMAESYGFSDSVSGGVSVLDVLVDAHVRAFGDEFTPETATAFLACADSGFVTTIFAVETSANGFIYNGSYPGGTNGTTVTTQPVYDGDTIEFFLYQDTDYWSDYITWFCENGVYTSSVKSNGKDPIELSVKGYMYIGGYLFNDAASLHGSGEPIDSARIGWVNVETGAISEIAGGTATEDGTVSIAPPAGEGIYYLTAFYNDGDSEGICCPLIMTLLEVVVDASYAPDKDIRGLSNLEVASFQSNPSALALTPAFDSKIYEYSAPEVDYEDMAVFRSFYVRATALSSTAQITAVLNGGDPVTLMSGNTMWTGFMMDKGLKPGANKLVVIVSDGGSSLDYVVNVTMFDPNAPVGPTPLDPVPPMADIEKLTKSTASYITSTVSDPRFSSTGGEWAVIGQTRGGFSGAADFAARYASNLAAELVRTNGILTTSTYTDYSRVILALTSAGYDVTDFAGYNLLQPLSDMTSVVKQGVNGPIWALVAFDSHAYEIPAVDSPDKTQTTRTGLISAIASAQLADGGWAIAGKSLDVDTTAMALIALAPYAQTSGNATAKTAVDKALSGLEGFLSNNSSAPVIAALGPDSYAQLVTALIACGIDPATDVRFGINGASSVSKLIAFSNNDGSFSRTEGSSADLRATEQSLLSLVAYKRYVNGGPHLYNMSDVVINKHQSVPASPDDPGAPNLPPAGSNTNSGWGNNTVGTAAGFGGNTFSLMNPETLENEQYPVVAGSDTASALNDVAAGSNAFAGNRSSYGEPAESTAGAGGAPSPAFIVGIALILAGLIGAAFLLSTLRMAKRRSAS